MIQLKGWLCQSMQIFGTHNANCVYFGAVSEFTDFIKTLSPSSLDMELRILQIVGDEDEEEPEKLVPIELLLDYFIHETACRNNFDFVQAVIRVFLKV